MRLDDLPTSDRIEDRRRFSGGRAGLGIGTVVILGLVGWALGIDPRVLIGGAEILSGSGQQQTDAGSTGAPPDEMGHFVSAILGSTETEWKDVSGALTVQMACCHTAAMAILAKLDSGFGTERRIAAFGSTAARLMKAYTMQMEVLRRLRNGGHQYVRVEHVQISDGGQAIIGNVHKPDVQG
jgi:hypothetical protein